MNDDSGRVRPLDPDGTTRPAGSGTTDVDRPGGGSPPMWVAVGAALMVGLLIGWLVGTSGSDGGNEAPEASASTVPSDGEAVGATTAATISGQWAAGSFVEPTITLLPDAGWLRLPIGLAMSPAGSDSQEMYVIDDAGSIRQRGDLPLIRELGRYALLWMDDALLYLGGGTAYHLASSLDDPPTDLGRASGIVPGATPDRAWLVGGDGFGDQIAVVDTATAEVGEWFDTSTEFDSPLGGAADGLVVRPVDTESDGTLAHWTPEGGAESFGLAGAEPGPFGSFLASSGDVAVIGLSFPDVAVLDVAAREVLTTFSFDPGDALWAKTCISPQERFVAMVGSNGRGVVVSTEDGSVIQEFEVGRTRGVINAIGWTTPDQLLRIVDDGEGRRLVALDIFTGSERDIASLDPTADWLLATPGSNC